MNPFDIIGAMMGSGMSRSGGNRMGDILGQMMGGGAPGGMGGGMPGGVPGGMPQGMPGGMQGGMPGGGIPDIFGKVLGGMLGGGGQPGAPGPGGAGGFAGDMLKNIAGAIFGGAGGQGNQAAGAGSMAIFGTLAAQALAMAQKMMTGGQLDAGADRPNFQMDDATAVIAGMRPPQTPLEQRQVMDIASLTLKAMINAAKADGQIDKTETERLLGKLKEGGVTDAEQKFVLEEMQKPLDLEGIVRAVPNQQVAAQIYTASLMAIDVDTDAERRYLQDLSAKLGLNQHVVAYLHQAVGLA